MKAQDYHDLMLRFANHCRRQSSGEPLLTWIIPAPIIPELQLLAGVNTRISQAMLQIPQHELLRRDNISGRSVAQMYYGFPCVTISNLFRVHAVVNGVMFDVESNNWPTLALPQSTEKEVRKPKVIEYRG